MKPVAVAAQALVKGSVPAFTLNLCGYLIAFHFLVDISRGFLANY